MDPSQMMPRSFPMWADDPSAAPQRPFLPPPHAQLAPNRGWKRKNPNSGGVGYQPPALGDLQVQNRAKARRWFKNPNPNPRKYFFRKPKAAAPRNTTSFIIRAKRAGGIASLVSPCPVTPAVLPTPRLSPSREGLADMAQAQWGVDGYGSMKGLIRLRRSPHPAGPNAAASDDDDDDEDDDDGNSSDSDVEEHVEVERRLDHDLSRFEMVYPGRGDDAGGYVFEEEDEYDQDAHVARLEEDNLTLKERFFLMEQEVRDMRRRLEALEARFSGADGAGGRGGAENAAVDEALENDTERGDANGSDKSGDNNAERGDAAGSEKNGENNAEWGDANGSGKSGDNNAEGGDAAGLDKSGDNNAEGGKSGDNNAERGDAAGSEKSSENNAESGVAAGSEKRGDNNAERGDAAGSEKSSENNAESGVAAGSEKRGDNNAERGDAAGSDKSGENNAESGVAAGSEKRGDNNAERGDVAGSDKSGEDHSEESMLGASSRD